jgi:hypothetical protein
VRGAKAYAADEVCCHDEVEGKCQRRYPYESLSR